jgi:hypothetical protein
VLSSLQPPDLTPEEALGLAENNAELRLLIREPGTDLYVNYLSRIISTLAFQVRIMSTELNDMKTKLGSTFVHWGKQGAPENLPAGLEAELVYAGHGFAARYDQNASEIQCIQKEVQWGETTNVSSGSTIYPLATGSNQNSPVVNQPASVPPLHLVPCSVIRVPRTTQLVTGPDVCPAGWNKLYGGYLMGGNATNPGNTPDKICLNDKEFNSQAIPAGSVASFVYGTTIAGISIAGGFPPQRFLKCAVCAK